MSFVCTLLQSYLHTNPRSLAALARLVAAGNLVHETLGADLALLHLLEASRDVLEGAADENGGALRPKFSTSAAVLAQAWRWNSRSALTSGSMKVWPRSPKLNSLPKGVGEEEDDVDVGAERLRDGVGGKEEVELAALGAEGLDGDLLRVALGDGVERARTHRRQ
jgi:hypothetical protein